MLYVLHAKSNDGSSAESAAEIPTDYDMILSVNLLIFTCKRLIKKIA